jgi:hypothetical protein
VILKDCPFWSKAIANIESIGKFIFVQINMPLSERLETVPV